MARERTVDVHRQEVLELIERRFRHAFEASIVGMALIDLDGRYLRVNQAFCALVGRPRDDLLARTWQSITHPDDVAQGDDYVRIAVATGAPLSRQVKRYLRPDGSFVWALVNVSLLTRDDGRPLCFFSQIVDIDEHQRAEAALQEAEKKHRALVEQLPGIVYTAEGGVEGRWLYVSPQIETMLGYKPQEWTSDPGAWFRAVHPDDKERVLQEESSEWARGPGYKAYGEYRLIARDGRTVWVRDEAAIIEGSPGAPSLWQGVIVDITHTKLLEKQVRHAHKMEAIGVLAGGAAHNFNNLLAVILNYAGFVIESLDSDDPARGDVEEILHAAKRASKLVRELLAFSRDEKVRAAMVDLNEVITAMEGLLRTALPSTVSLVADLGQGLPATKADAGQVEQVVLNLVLNARDAVDGRGEIRVSTTFERVHPRAAAARPGLHPGEYVCVEVIDDGCGMTEEVKARIFEPFFTTKGKALGTGLGLASVYGIVKQWQGYIDVDSAPGRGTCMKVYLPAADLRSPVSPSTPGALHR
jgi:two-component system cell cycle sensor histidine kinase/response regulator CckA